MSRLKYKGLSYILFLIALASTQAAHAWQAAATSDHSKPAPDVIVFQNGDQLSGTLVRGVGDSVIFKSDIVGEVTVPLSKVKELRSSGSFAVLRTDRPVTRANTQTGTVTVAGTAVTVAHPTGPAEEIPIKQVAYIIDQVTYDRELEKRAGPLYGWTGTLTGGSTYVQSTQHGGTFTAGVGLVRAIPTVAYLRTRNRTIFNLAETYGQLTTPAIPPVVCTSPTSPTDPCPPADSVVKTSIFHTDLERDQYVSQRFYYLGNLAFDHNYSSGLDLQQIYGGGFGWTPISTPKHQLDVKADVHYEKQEFEVASNNLNIIGSTFAEAYKRNLPHKLVFTETAAILPAWNRSEAYQANFAAALSMPVFKRLSVILSTTDTYLNNPSPGFKPNTFQFVTGVTYSLK